jgi:hypothetical protein
MPAEAESAAALANSVAEAVRPACARPVKAMRDPASVDVGTYLDVLGNAPGILGPLMGRVAGTHDLALARFVGRIIVVAWIRLWMRLTCAFVAQTRLAQTDRDGLFSVFHDWTMLGPTV